MDEKILKRLQQLQEKYDEPLVDYGCKYYHPSNVDLDTYDDSVYFWLSYDDEGRIKRCGVSEDIKKTVTNMVMQEGEFYISIHEVIVEGTKANKLLAIKDYKQQLRRALSLS